MYRCCCELHWRVVERDLLCPDELIHSKDFVLHAFDDLNGVCQPEIIQVVGTRSGSLDNHS